ncbi:hypothetical protein PRK78_000428 [Emydomyces testavorans]|uniref:Uncharacterized protein n=1 Tax=Emydomyces testavorans TaxID=2070801 RepID=A0AAF0IFU1_9EURO|nr:hypothetical protein PRK78_000428 [Emydomyces testavorans]
MFGAQGANLSYLQKMRGVHQQIIDYLRRFGVNVNHYREYPGDLRAWTIEKANAVSVQEIPDIDCCSDEWEFFEVKLETRVLPYHRSSFFEVDRVLTLIKDEYTTFVNNSCAMTVHVGNVPWPNPRNYASHGFNLSAVQTLLQFVWKFEAQINALHPAHRVWGNSRCLPPTATLGSIEPNMVIREILDCVDMEELYDLWEGDLTEEQTRHKAAAYSIRRLTDPDDSSVYNGTIRFGQHKGTLDFEEVKNWVWFVGCLVKFAVDRGPCGIPLELMGPHGSTAQLTLRELSPLEFVACFAMWDQFAFYSEQLSVDYA